MVIPFGLCNAPATFQRLVVYIFTDSLFKSIIVFVDNFSTQSNAGSHLECVREALVTCRMMQLALNPDKTFLGVHKIVLLDYVISEKGREPNPDKITVIDDVTHLSKGMPETP